MIAISALALGLAYFAGAADPAQDARVAVTPHRPARKTPGQAHSIRVDSNLILIPVSVTNTFGAPFAGLPREAFRLFEDGVEQQVKFFSAEDAPLSLGIIFDASRSMEGKLDQSRLAVSKFLNTRMTSDEFSLIEFNDAPRLLCGFTNDAERIEKMLGGIRARNWTALLDAVYLAIHQMKRASNPRKALLILSDGGDNNSRYTETEMKSLVREADVCIYSVAFVGTGLLKRHQRMLARLSEETGGRLYEIGKMNELPEAIARISSALRHQYVLGYSSSNPRRNGLYRNIKVRLHQPPDQPPLRASWREGYYAPSDE
jgi:Ca-activated chloride channel homolog